MNLIFSFIFFKWFISHFFQCLKLGFVGELTQIIDAILNSGVLIPAIWLSLGFFIAWFLLSARIHVSLTPNETEMLWKFHKQNSNCKANNWNKIFRKKEIIGLTCECGYKHIQKKPLINLS